MKICTIDAWLSPEAKAAVVSSIAKEPEIARLNHQAANEEFSKLQGKVSRRKSIILRECLKYPKKELFEVYTYEKLHGFELTKAKIELNAGHERVSFDNCRSHFIREIRRHSDGSVVYTRPADYMVEDTLCTAFVDYDAYKRMRTQLSDLHAELSKAQSKLFEAASLCADINRSSPKRNPDWFPVRPLSVVRYETFSGKRGHALCLDVIVHISGNKPGNVGVSIVPYTSSGTLSKNRVNPDSIKRLITEDDRSFEFDRA